MMKGIHYIVAGVLAASTQVYGAGIGDRMPNTERYKILNHGQIMCETKSPLLLLKENDEGKRYMVGYDCDVTEYLKGGCKPFAIYDPETKKLYLDNDPTDGVIDNIVNGEKVPVCDSLPK